MRVPALLALFSILAACATGARAQGGNSGAPPSDAAIDAGRDGSLSGATQGAEADLQQAVAKNLAGDPKAALAIAKGLRAANSDSVRTRAATLSALILVQQGDFADALAQLTPGPTASAEVNFLAAVAEARLGKSVDAWARLAPFIKAGAPPGVLGAQPDRLAMLFDVAVAESASNTGRVKEALQAWQRYTDRAQPHEKAFALRRADAAIGHLSLEDALALWNSAREKLARAVLGPKAGLALAAQGQADQARRASDEAMELRKQFDAGANATTAWVGTGDPGRLGLAVPLTGAGQQLGVALTRGAMVALGAPGSAQDVGPVQVMVRDAMGRGGAITAASELSREEAVLGIVGLADAPTIEQMSRDGVPYLVLGGPNPGPQTSAFQLVHDTESRAQALARLARAKGARNFAILAPSTDAARRTAEAFRQAVVADGGQVVVQATYAPTATGFTKEVEAIKKQRWEALFVPDTAEKLELIAPALAVADLWPQPATQAITPVGETKPKSSGPPRRNILLLATAPGTSQRLIERAGRYVQGALLAPGFHADPEQATSARFVAEFRTLYGRDPGASDAYGFDGVHLLRACVDRGARTRNDVLRLLGSGAEFRGVTGNIRFGGDHGRQDTALIYEVRGDRIAALP